MDLLETIKETLLTKENGRFIVLLVAFSVLIYVALIWLSKTFGWFGW